MMSGKRKHSWSAGLTVVLVLATAACSGPAGTTPAASPDVAGACTREAVLVGKPGVPGGTGLASQAGFRVTWNVQNSGTCAWPEGTQLIPVVGDTFEPSLGVDVPPALPGEIQAISVDLTAPLAPGVYEAGWQMSAADGTLFGELLPLSIVVLQPTRAPATETATIPTGAATTTPSSTRTPSPTRTASRSPTPTATRWAGYPQLGSRGPLVVAIQYLLRAEGYALEADGDFGPLTEAAVLAFQRQEGLGEDGVLNSETESQLVRDHEVELGDRGDAVRAVQYMLVHMYGYDLAIDGEFGPATRDAVIDFQEARVTLFEIGVVGGFTWWSLFYGQ